LDHGWPRYMSRRRTQGRYVRRVAALAILALLTVCVLGVGIGQITSSHPHRGVPLLIAILLIIPIGFVMVLLVRGLRQTTRPIEMLMDATDRVAQGDYGTRVPVGGPPDVRNMMSSFNEMTERLQVNDEQRRLLLADIAHELRNPLAIIRGNVEGMIDGIYSRDEAHLTLLIDETLQMSRLLDDLQLLAQAETGTLVMLRTQVELGAFLTDLVRLFQTRAESAGITLSVIILQPGIVSIDPGRIRQVLENLLSNAIRHTPAGEKIEVVGTVGTQGAVVEVADTGSGIEPELLAHLFDRFTKSADSGGSGLGLSIAKQLVEAHGGEIMARSTPGAGTSIRFRLPATTPS